jgi:hypothetical protein
MLRTVLEAMMEEQPATVADSVQQAFCGLVVAAVRDQRWGEAIDLTSWKGIEAYAQRHKISWKRLSERLLKNLLPLQTEFVARLAQSDALTETAPDAQQKVSEALKELFSEGNRFWTGWKRFGPIRQTGAAIERAGKIIDALEFYEQRTQDETLTPQEQQFSRERLVRCREKRAAYLREKEHRGVEAEKVDKEVRQLREQWRIRGPFRTFLTCPAALRLPTARATFPPTTKTTGWWSGGRSSGRVPTGVFKSMTRNRTSPQFFSLANRP